MDQNGLPRSAYNMVYNLCENGRINRVSHIKNILYRFGYVYTYQEVGDPKRFLPCFSERIVDCYKQEWNSLLNDSSVIIANIRLHLNLKNT